MKIVIFTSNETRHRYVANALSKAALARGDEILIMSEHPPHDPSHPVISAAQEASFAERRATEEKFFPGEEKFVIEPVSIERGKVNDPEFVKQIEAFKPDAGFVFGSSILKEDLLKQIPSGKFVNMHLGLSPYYRGSSTNLWPLINGEPEYVGVTLLHIDPGIDTGDIIAQVRPIITENDTLHSIGCKTIMAGADQMVRVLGVIHEGKELPRIKQWEVTKPRVYKRRDVQEWHLSNLNQSLPQILKEFLTKPPKEIQLVPSITLPSPIPKIKRPS